MKPLALILAAVFVVIAILYWTGHFVPAGVHLKHGIVSIILALLPGISRAGSAIVAGLLRDLHHEDAARYSFLLATPVILAASLLEFPKLFAPDAHVVLVQAVVGGVVAGITAYASVAFLTRYFRHNDLSPFAWYCIAAGAVSFVLFATKVIA